MKYKIGDKVKIRKDLKTGRKYKAENTDERVSFVSEMKPLCRSTATISAVIFDKVYRLKEDSESYNWTIDMFENVSSMCCKSLL